MRDLSDNIHPVLAMPPKAATVDNTAYISGIIDRFGYDSLTYILLTGTEADADATFAVTLEHGNDPALADTTQVTDPNQMTGTLTLAGFNFANDNVCRKLGYIGPCRYTRLTVTPANNSANVFLSAIALLGHAHNAPTPNPPA